MLNNNDKASKFAKDLIDLDLILLWLKNKLNRASVVFIISFCFWGV